MGYSLKDFCRDTIAILKTGSNRQHVDKIQRIFGRQTGAPAAVS